MRSPFRSCRAERKPRSFPRLLVIAHRANSNPVLPGLILLYPTLLALVDGEPECYRRSQSPPIFPKSRMRIAG